MGKIAFLFAGQGAQAPGMGEAFYNASPAARDVFDAVERQRPGTLEQCFHGDAAELVRTVNTQPCLFATDLACAMAAKEAGVVADCAAGFSLGELCAVAFAGMLPVEDVARLVIRRGELMQACNDAHPGAMLAVLKLTARQVEDICAEFDGAYPVNYNSPGQTVVACAAGLTGDSAAKVKAAGGRCMPLKVGGSFHTPVMRPATEGLAEMLEGMTVSRQASSPVHWQQTIEAMAAAGVDTFVEFGPGTTLAGLVKRTLTDVRTASVAVPEDLEKLLETLRAE